MNIIPAIDIINGEAVRLYQGCYDKVTSYAKDPILLAQAFAADGATMLHIVDLDGAKKGEMTNLDLIEKIITKSNLSVQVGGGIRSKQQIAYLIQRGVSRVVLGSIAILKPLEVKNWLSEFGAENITLAFDIRMNFNTPQLALHGWQDTSTISLWAILKDYQKHGLQHVLCTDINRDGTLQGPNIPLYQKCLRQFPSVSFQASGGIGSLNDLRALAKTSIKNVVIGKALYEKQFSLQDALEITKC